MIIEVFFMMVRFTLTLVRYVTAEKVTIMAIKVIKDGGAKDKVGSEQKHDRCCN